MQKEALRLLFLLARQETGDGKSNIVFSRIREATEE